MDPRFSHRPASRGAWLLPGFLAAFVAGCGRGESSSPPPPPAARAAASAGPAPRPSGAPAAASPARTAERAAADRFFSGPVQTFELQLDERALDSLRGEPRKPVAATLRVGSNRLERVAVRIKGAAGSTRPIDDRPALTLNFDKFHPGQTLAGLDKLHLNNSVQDPSRMSEILCADLYLRAGVPAARATHGVVRLNGRTLGLYVVKEGFDRRFLRRFFARTDGNLYDGGFLQDIDSRLERDAGDGPDTQDDLRRLREACDEPDDSRRQARLEQVLEVERFLTYVALQVLTEDWDGYPLNHNNYRIYFDPGTGRAVFFPHGMDQMFDRPGLPLLPGFSGRVAERALAIPAWRERYLQRVASLLTNVFTEPAVMATFQGAVRRRDAVLGLVPGWERAEILGATAALEQRLLQRLQNAAEQLASQPAPARFDASGQAALGRWLPRTEGGRQERVTGPGGPPALHLVSRGSWRTRLRLPAGRYAFEGRGQVRGVLGGEGLGLRLSGTQRTQQLRGDSDWQDLRFEFQCPEEREVELVAELRSDAGEGWFETASLRLRRLP